MTNRVLCSGALLLSLLAACSRRAVLEHTAPGGSASSHAPMERQNTPEERARASVYELELSLLDQNGQSVRLGAFRGHPVVVSMFYASCPFACPTLINDIRKLEKRLSPAARADLRVVLVSFDPEHDTPAVLAELATARGLDGARWTLATTSTESVRELAAVLGIKYRKLDGGGFNHTSLITVLDRDGTLLARSEVGDGGSDQLVAALGGRT